jgi:hypothetical protein
LVVRGHPLHVLGGVADEVVLRMLTVGHTERTADLLLAKGMQHRAVVGLDERARGRRSTGHMPANWSGLNHLPCRRGKTVGLGAVDT